MLTYPTMAPKRTTDAELVSQTLAGNRDAFTEIVSRYQTLVCSLAFSATGDLARSEDLAQDTFLAVWRDLAKIREPDKLRAWICTIARNRIQDSYRSQYREPVFKAEPLDRAGESPALDTQPSDQAVREDDMAMMWRTLEQVPETFREPLILFYRENQSVARVAAALDLTEDAVKQRLARGRKLLQAEVEIAVESALRRTAPGPVFTSNVLSALPIGSIAAANIASATATVATKGAVGGGVAGAILKVVTSPLPLLGALLLERKRMLAKESESVSLEERDLLARHRQTVLGFLVIAGGVMIFWSRWYKGLDQSVWFAPLVPLVLLPLMFGVGVRVVTTRCALARIWSSRGQTPVKRSWEYRSRWHPRGLPFVHVRLGFKPQWPASDRAVKAWIAIGNVAFGRLFAFGYVAIAPLSVGGFAMGIGSVGFFALGVAAFGACALGGYVVGIVAMGWMAAGGLALGLNAASGFDAYARNFAQSPLGPKHWAAYATHANDEVSREFFATNGYFSRISPLFHSADRRAVVTLLLSMAPLVVWEVIWEIMKGGRKSDTT